MAAAPLLRGGGVLDLGLRGPSLSLFIAADAPGGVGALCCTNSWKERGRDESLNAALVGSGAASS